MNEHNFSGLGKSNSGNKGGGGGFIATAVQVVTSIFPSVINMFGQQVSPQEQAQKAGVWGNMLQEFLLNPNMPGEVLGRTWKDQLPFRQSSTKSRFVSNNLTGKSRNFIIGHLIEKINDEFVKAGLPTISKDRIMANFNEGKRLLPEVSDILPGSNNNYQGYLSPQVSDSGYQNNYGYDQYDPRQRALQSQIRPANASIGSMPVVLLIGATIIGGYLFLNKTKKS